MGDVRLSVLLSFVMFLGGTVLVGADVTLVVNALYPASNLPQGSTLYLRGNTTGLNWQSGVEMKYQGNNLWSISLSYSADQAGSVLAMKTLVDDNTWQIGPNSLVMLPKQDSQVSIYPWYYTIEGVYGVLPHKIWSPQLQNDRSLVIYTPPSYFENTLKYYENVLVMHDGQNLFNASTSYMGVAWDCQDTINALVYEGLMDEVVIIGVYNTPNRINEYTYSYDPNCSCPHGAGGEGDLYLDFLEENVVPHVAKQFRILTAQPNMGILGSSLGGLISCYAGYTRSEVYSKAGCMSSSFWWNDQDFNNSVLIEFRLPPYPLQIYLDSGNAGPDDDDEQETITVRQHLEKLGFVINETLFYYLDVGGQHNEYYWGQRFWVPMTYFYSPALLPTAAQGDNPHVYAGLKLPIADFEDDPRFMSELLARVAASDE